MSHSACKRKISKEEKENEQRSNKKQKSSKDEEEEKEEKGERKKSKTSKAEKDHAGDSARRCSSRHRRADVAAGDAAGDADSEWAAYCPSIAAIGPAAGLSDDDIFKTFRFFTSEIRAKRPTPAHSLMSFNHLIKQGYVIGNLLAIPAPRAVRPYLPKT